MVILEENLGAPANVRLLRRHLTMENAASQ
jgi:hypothetical protein